MHQAYQSKPQVNSDRCQLMHLAPRSGILQRTRRARFGLQTVTLGAVCVLFVPGAIVANFDYFDEAVNRSVYVSARPHQLAQITTYSGSGFASYLKYYFETFDPNRRGHMPWLHTNTYSQGSEIPIDLGYYTNLHYLFSGISLHAEKKSETGSRPIHRPQRSRVTDQQSPTTTGPSEFDVHKGVAAQEQARGRSIASFMRRTFLKSPLRQERQCVTGGSSCQRIIGHIADEAKINSTRVATGTIIESQSSDLDVRHRAKISRVKILHDLFGATRQQVFAPARAATASGELKRTGAKKSGKRTSVVKTRRVRRRSHQQARLLAKKRKRQTKYSNDKIIGWAADLNLGRPPSWVKKTSSFAR